MRVEDLRAAGAQQHERSVKEFGAVCDGVAGRYGCVAGGAGACRCARCGGAWDFAAVAGWGLCKTHQLVWHLESIGGQGKQVSGLMGFPGRDVLATGTDATQPAEQMAHAAARPDDLCGCERGCFVLAGGGPGGGGELWGEPADGGELRLFSPGGNGLTGTAGTGAGWWIGNCAIAIPATLGTGGNGLKTAEIENRGDCCDWGRSAGGVCRRPIRRIRACGALPGAVAAGERDFAASSIRGVGTGIALPVLPVIVPAGLTAGFGC